jgi:hypothetical protein
MLISGKWTQCAAWLALLLALCGCTGADTERADVPADKDVTLGLDIAADTPQRLSVTLRAKDAHRLHQLSCRLQYDPAAVRLLEVRPGGLPPDDAVFFSSDRLPGVAALAFTCRPEQPLDSSSGKIAVLQFEVLDSTIDPGIALLRDPEYLIARDSLRRDLDVFLEVQP